MSNENNYTQCLQAAAFSLFFVPQEKSLEDAKKELISRCESLKSKPQMVPQQPIKKSPIDKNHKQ